MPLANRELKEAAKANGDPHKGNTKASEQEEQRIEEAVEDGLVPMPLANRQLENVAKANGDPHKGNTRASEQEEGEKQASRKKVLREVTNTEAKTEAQETKAEAQKVKHKEEEGNASRHPHNGKTSASEPEEAGHGDSGKHVLPGAEKATVKSESQNQKAEDHGHKDIEDVTAPVPTKQQRIEEAVEDGLVPMPLANRELKEAAKANGDPHKGNTKASEQEEQRIEEAVEDGLVPMPLANRELKEAAKANGDPHKGHASASEHGEAEEPALWKNLLRDITKVDSKNKERETKAGDQKVKHKEGEIGASPSSHVLKEAAPASSDSNRGKPKANDAVPIGKEERQAEAMEDGLVPKKNSAIKPANSMFKNVHTSMDRMKQLEEIRKFDGSQHGDEETAAWHADPPIDDVVEELEKLAPKDELREEQAGGHKGKPKANNASHMKHVLQEAAESKAGGHKRKAKTNKATHMKDVLQEAARNSTAKDAPLEEKVISTSGAYGSAQAEKARGRKDQARAYNASHMTHVLQEAADNSTSKEEQQKEKVGGHHQDLQANNASHMKEVIGEVNETTHNLHRGKAEAQNQEHDQEIGDTSPVDHVLQEMEREQAKGIWPKEDVDLGKQDGDFGVGLPSREQEEKTDNEILPSVGDNWKTLAASMGINADEEQEVPAETSVKVSGQQDTLLAPEVPTDEADHPRRKRKERNQKFNEQVEDASPVNEVLKKMEEAQAIEAAKEDSEEDDNSAAKEENEESDVFWKRVLESKDLEAEQRGPHNPMQGSAAKEHKHKKVTGAKAIPASIGGWKAKEDETRKRIEAEKDEDTVFQESKRKQGPGDLEIFPTRPDNVWKYLPYASGVPVRCGPPMTITCASDDGVTCQFGVYGQELPAFSPMPQVNASKPVKLDCPGWDLKGDTDACEAMDCYQAVGFGVLLKNWYNVDPKTNTFTADIVLTFRWFNPLATRVMAGSAGQITMSTTEARDRNLWLPDIAVSNRDVNGTEVISSSILIDKSGSCQLVERLLVKVREEFQPEAFPFDVQSLNIKLASTNKMATQLKLEPIGDAAVMGVDPAKFDRSEYSVLDVSWKAYTEMDGNLLKSRGVLTLTLKHKAATWISSMIMPTLAVTLMGTLAFYFPIDAPFAMPRLSICAFGLLILIVIRSRVELSVNMYPKVWVDNLYCSCLALVFAFTLFNAWLQYLHFELKLNEQEGNLPRKINNELKVFFPVLYLAVCAIVFASRTGEYASLQGWALTTVIGLAIFGYVVHCAGRVYKLKAVR